MTSSIPNVLTLPSNACLDLYPDNVIGRYTVKLPHPLELEGDHEVALTGMVYPISWYNFPQGRVYSLSIKVIHTADHVREDGPESHEDEVEEGDIVNRDAEEEGEDEGQPARLHYNRKVVLRPGHYGSPDKVMDILNAKAVPSGVRFIYSSITQRVTVKTVTGRPSTILSVELVLSPDLAYKLGWPDVEQGLVLAHQSSRIVSPGVMNLEEVEVLYVNCDLASPSHVVGSSLVPLLKTVAVKGQYGAAVQFEPMVLDWIPVRHRRITTASVLITDSTGRLVPFERGRCSVKVHLRRRVAP